MSSIKKNNSNYIFVCLHFDVTPYFYIHVRRKDKYIYIYRCISLETQQSSCNILFINI